MTEPDQKIVPPTKTYTMTVRLIVEAPIGKEPDHLSVDTDYIHVMDKDGHYITTPVEYETINVEAAEQ
jgi:hypothetical protein